MMMMPTASLLLAALLVTRTGGVDVCSLTSFSNGLAAVTVTTDPVVVLNYSLPVGVTIGSSTHFWCTGGDGESSPRVFFTP